MRTVRLAVPNFEKDLACHEELVCHLAHISNFPDEVE